MSSIRRLARLAAALAVAFSASGAVPAALASVPPTVPEPVADNSVAPASDTPPELVQSWTLAPAGSLDGDAAGNRPNLTYLASPGTVIPDAVIVYNFSNVPMNFRVYATDAFNNDEGQFDLLPGDQKPVDVGSWVSIAQENITLPPGKQATIPITITVPLDAAPGDHAGAIVAASTSQSDNGDGQVVNVEWRTGTRLYMQVSGQLTRELSVLEVAGEYHHALNPFGGSTDVTFRVENRGNTRLGGTPTVTVDGPFGLGERTLVLPELVELLPGEDVTVTATLDGVPALLSQTATVRIDPPAAAVEAGAEAAIGTDRLFAPPLTLLLLVLAGVFALLAVRAYRRHRSGDGPSADPSQSPEQHDRERFPQPV